MSDPVSEGWGVATPPTTRKLVCFWFCPPGGGRFSDLDMTGTEALALEAKIGCAWNEMRPLGVLEHRMAVLELFLARSDPEHAHDRVGAMTVAELTAAVEAEWGRADDLPDQFEDGLPKAVTAVS